MTKRKHPDDFAKLKGGDNRVQVQWERDVAKTALKKVYYRMHKSHLIVANEQAVIEVARALDLLGVTEDELNEFIARMEGQEYPSPAVAAFERMMNPLPGEQP